MKIRIKPLSKRAKDRVREHGDTFSLKERATFRDEPAILVESLEPTWGGFWVGWFCESEFEEIK